VIISVIATINPVEERIKAQVKRVTVLVKVTKEMGIAVQVVTFQNVKS